MRWDSAKFSLLLYGMSRMLRFRARRHPEFAQRLAEKNFTAQIRTFDSTVGRSFTFRDGNIISAPGIHAPLTSAFP